MDRSKKTLKYTFNLFDAQLNKIKKIGYFTRNEQSGKKIKQLDIHKLIPGYKKVKSSDAYKKHFFEKLYLRNNVCYNKRCSLWIKEMENFKQKKTQFRKDLKELILKQTRIMVQKHGIQQLSMRKLAKELGCSPGNLYIYFKNKDEILNQLVEDSFAVLGMRLKGINKKGMTTKNYLKKLLHAYLNFGLEFKDHYQFAFMVPRFGTETLTPHEAYFFLVNVVKECMEQKFFSPGDPNLISQSIWTGIHGITSLFIVLPNFPWFDQEALMEHHINVLIESHMNKKKENK